MKNINENTHVLKFEHLISPYEVKKDLPSLNFIDRIMEYRKICKDIIDRKHHRLLVIVGPCSIHDPVAAIEYAQKLKQLAEELKEIFFIVMRVYFEKPRTTVGWKGLINDPHLNESCDVSYGIKLARKILIDITALGLPIATETLDPIAPQYIGDLVTWVAIGARTTESQTHRELASGLSTPVGFKNGTDGNIQVALDAIQASQKHHSFIGIDQDGITSIVRTKGNHHCHLVVRGGKKSVNYLPEDLEKISQQLREHGISDSILVDCGHANSNKDPYKQPSVWENVVEQKISGTKNIIGLMLESNLYGGNQQLTDPSKLLYGVSITDSCLDWNSTEILLRSSGERISKINKRLE